MADRLALCANRLITAPTLELMHQEEKQRVLSAEGSSQQTNDLDSNQATDEVSFSGEEDGSGVKAECRICQEDDMVPNMEAPCACAGSIKVKLRSFHSCSISLSVYDQQSAAN